MEKSDENKNTKFEIKRIVINDENNVGEIIDIRIADISELLKFCIDFSCNIKDILNECVFTWASCCIWEEEIFIHVLKEDNEVNQKYIIQLLRNNFLYNPELCPSFIAKYINILVEYYKESKISSKPALEVDFWETVSTLLTYNPSACSLINTEEIYLIILEKIVSTDDKNVINCFSIIYEYINKDFIGTSFYDVFNFAINLIEKGDYRNGSLLLLTILKKSILLNKNLELDFEKLISLTIKSANEKKLHENGILIFIQTILINFYDYSFIINFLCQQLRELIDNYDQFSYNDKLYYIMFIFECTKSFPETICFKVSKEEILEITQLVYSKITDLFEVCPKKAFKWTYWFVKTVTTASLEEYFDINPILEVIELFNDSELEENSKILKDSIYEVVNT